MTTVPSGFPSNLSDDELARVVHELQESNAEIDAYSTPSLMLLDAGLTERLRRTVEKASRDSNRIAFIALSVGVLAVVASVAQLWIG